ncbi:MAG: DUF2878 domain-containing protein [Alkalimonas sp.]|nr:DUF2878 domain-containing protein [Alkalimonas sp.]
MKWRALIGFELGWLALVIFQFWALLPVAIYIAWALNRLVRTQQTLVLQLAIMGIVLDSLLVWLGVMSFTTSAWLPLWFLLLWCLFALTVVEAFADLLKPVWLAPILGAIGGPLSYLGGAVLSGGILVMPLGWMSWASLAVVWAILAYYFATIPKERLHAQMAS